MHTIDIRDNITKDCQMGTTIASEGGSLVRDINIFNNLFYDNVRVGVEFSTSVDNGPREKIKVLNNTVIGGVYGVLALTQNIKELTIKNNIFRESSYLDLDIRGGNFGGRQIVTSNNYTKNLADPQFRDRANADFRLKYTSPAIGYADGTGDTGAHACLLNSCGAFPVNFETYFGVTPGKFVMEKAGGSKTFQIQNSREGYTVSSDQGWAQVTENGNSITITTPNYNGPLNRIANVTLTNGEYTKTIEVLQMGVSTENSFTGKQPIVDANPKAYSLNSMLHC